MIRMGGGFVLLMQKSEGALSEGVLPEGFVLRGLSAHPTGVAYFKWWVSGILRPVWIPVSWAINKS